MCIFCLVLEQLWTHHKVLSRGEADQTCKRFRGIGFTRQDFCRYHCHDLVRKTHHNRASAVPGKAEYCIFSFRRKYYFKFYCWTHSYPRRNSPPMNTKSSLLEYLLFWVPVPSGKQRSTEYLKDPFSDIYSS